MISATINKMPTIVQIMPLFILHLIEPGNGSANYDKRQIRSLYTPTVGY